MKCLILLIATTLAILTVVECKTFTQCELARLLHNRFGFRRKSLGDWMCLVKHESNFHTEAINTRNTDGSWDYGLFQINSRYWCGKTHPGGDCHVACKSLLNSDIADDVKCVKKIFKRHGFSAWMGWKAHCRGKPLPNVNHCF